MSIFKSIINIFKKKEPAKPLSMPFVTGKVIRCVSCFQCYEVTNLHSNETNWMCDTCKARFRIDAGIGSRS